MQFAPSFSEEKCERIIIFADGLRNLGLGIVLTKFYRMEKGSVSRYVLAFDFYHVRSLSRIALYFMALISSSLTERA